MQINRINDFPPIKKLQAHNKQSAFHPTQHSHRTVYPTYIRIALESTHRSDPNGTHTRHILNTDNGQRWPSISVRSGLRYKKISYSNKNRTASLPDDGDLVVAPAQRSLPATMCVAEKGSEASPRRLLIVQNVRFAVRG